MELMYFVMILNIAGNCGQMEPQLRSQTPQKAKTLMLQWNFGCKLLFKILITNSTRNSAISWVVHITVLCCEWIFLIVLCCWLYLYESDYQNKVDACKQKIEEARSETAADADLDLLQRELEEELEKEHLLKEEFR